MENHVGKGKRKRPFYKRRGFGYSLLFFALMIFVGAGYYAYSFYNFANSISKPKSDKASSNAEEWTGTDRVNIALIGVDTRPGDEAPRGDTMMVLSIDPKTKKASLFSIMRDTYYKIPGYGFRKINEAHALGGPELVVDTLSKFMQLNIDYYVKTDFKGFANIVDVLGGIDLYVEKDMYHPDDGIYDINLKQGMQHLDGKHALMYVRYRGDAMSDYARTERQRKFLATLASELKSTSSLLKLPEILKAVQDDIETDMSFSDMLKLGRLAYNLDISSMDSIQLPPMTDSTGQKPALLESYRGGASVIIPDLYETRLLVHKTLNTGHIVVKTYDDQEPLVHERTTPPKSSAAAPPPQTPPLLPTVPSQQEDSKAGRGTNQNNGSTPTIPGDKSKTGGSSTGGTGSGDSKPGDGSTSGSGTKTQGSTKGGSSTGGSTGSSEKTKGTGDHSNALTPFDLFNPPASS